PTTVKQTVAAVAVDLGWAAIANQDEARKARQKMKSEATPPPNAPPKKFNKGAASTTLSSPVAGGGGTTTTPVPSAAMSPTQAPPMATSTPKPAMTPRATATSTPLPALSASPTASQRRGRLLLPTGTPTPNATAVATTTPTPFKRPTAVEEPTAIPSAPAGTASQQPMRGKPKSQGQNFGPPNAQPTPSEPAAT